jgi:hypothetical protein
MPAIEDNPDNPWMGDLARDEEANQPPPEVDEDAMAEWYRQGEPDDEKAEKRRFGRKK